MLTRKDIAPKINQVRDEVAKWNAADAPMVQWRGAPRKAISDAVVEAFHELFDHVATMDVADDVKAVVLSIDTLEDAIDKWAETCEVSPEDGDADPRGTASLWSAWDELLEVLSTPRRRKPEDIRTLETEKVSERQIALIYGWVDDSGVPDIAKVREEKAEPGTHYNPDTWVHPSEKRAIEEVRQQWKQRQDRVDSRVAANRTAPEAPETLEELIQQKVPSKQIAMMKGVDIEAVRAKAADMGVPLDGQFVRRVSPADRLADQREAELDREAEIERRMQADNPPAGEASEESQEDGAAAGDNQESAAGVDDQKQPNLVDQILERYVDGKTPKQIADELQGEHPKLTYQKVQRIVQKAEEEYSQMPAESAAE